MEAPVRAYDGEAFVIDRNDFTELAGDALRVLGRQRLRVENFHGLAVERGPCAGRRIAAADQAVDLLPRLAPVDFGVAGAASAFIGGLRIVLFDAWRLAGFHEIHAFQHRLDAHRKQAIEIDRAERVSRTDRGLFLDKYVAGIEPV